MHVSRHFNFNLIAFVCFVPSIFMILLAFRNCSIVAPDRASDEDSDADEITDYLNTNSVETKHEPVSVSSKASATSAQTIYSSKLGGAGTERDLNHSSSSCSSSSTNSAHNSHTVGRKKTYATLGSNAAKMVMNCLHFRLHRTHYSWLWIEFNASVASTSLAAANLNVNWFYYALLATASAFANASGIAIATGW